MRISEVETPGVLSKTRALKIRERERESQRGELSQDPEKQTLEVTVSERTWMHALAFPLHTPVLAFCS